MDAYNGPELKMITTYAPDGWWSYSIWIGKQDDTREGMSPAEFTRFVANCLRVCRMNDFPDPVIALSEMEEAGNG